MPRCPVRDYADRCAAIEMQQRGLRPGEIAAALQRPVRWVRRTVKRYDAAVGVASLADHSSRPQRSPAKTPPEIATAICELKHAHPAWGRRQIARQLRWQWRTDPARQPWVSVGRVRRVLAQHPELAAPAPAAPARMPPRQIDYLACNLLWAADFHETHLTDGSVWYTLHWLDLYSRFELGQLTTQHMTEELVVQSFLAVAQHYGLPQIVKTDHDKLWYDGVSGLPSYLTRVLCALGVYHLLVGPKQPWWNGVVERYVRTCRQEVVLPPPEASAAVPQAIETARQFYNETRCHSQCHDQPPAALYQPSLRRVPPDFDPRQAPFTQEPLVLSRQVQARGCISLAGRTFPFSPRYAHQSITVTVTGWCAVGQAADGWQRTWDLHDQAAQLPAAPLPPAPPQPLTRKVDRQGCVMLKCYRYYIGIAWAGQTLRVQRHEGTWTVSLPDGAQKPYRASIWIPSPRPSVSCGGPTPQQRPSQLKPTC